MKVFQYRRNGKIEIGILKNDGLEMVPVNYLGSAPRHMVDFLEHLTPEKKKRLDRNKEMVRGIPMREIEVLSPYLRGRQDMICLGINYHDHAEESARFHNEAFGGERPVPIYFSKRFNRGVGDGEMVDGHFDIVDSMDYEAELGVILSKDAKNVSEKDAFNYVFGYTIINDYSARNLQTNHKQWYFGKSLDDYTAIGPCIVTADEFDNPPALAIKSFVNDELRQNSNTSLMINGIAKVISQLSQGVTLQAGTIIATGTPSGVGMGFEPPKFLKKGDVVRCEIEGIGSLTNYIK
ncbi:fumarylacetoacetate hydrolase family protein [Chakrabartyella piscis]|uniref:fumarylacetoacetate hydrolase family protein n=1 Tax=Chakrabartyella piscis TaxID=2918914 RepID=UPI0029585E31|nr:fumarylacetoacetate hydrolase family protein [Chakrabartyella piscis]